MEGHVPITWVHWPLRRDMQQLTRKNKTIEGREAIYYNQGDRQGNDT